MGVNCFGCGSEGVTVPFFYSGSVAAAAVQAREGECVLAPSSLCHVTLWGCLESGFVGGGDART